MRGPIKRKKLKKALKKKGFKKSIGGNHTKFFFYYRWKKTSIFTIFSRGSKYKKYDISLLSKMSTQLKMTNKQFENFIKCQFTEKDYIRNLKERGILS